MEVGERALEERTFRALDTELRSCVNAVADVPGSPSLIVLMVSVD